MTHIRTTTGRSCQLGCYSQSKKEQPRSPVPAGIVETIDPTYDVPNRFAGSPLLCFPSNTLFCLILLGLVRLLTEQSANVKAGTGP